MHIVQWDGNSTSHRLPSYLFCPDVVRFFYHRERFELRNSCPLNRATNSITAFVGNPVSNTWFFLRIMSSHSRQNRASTALHLRYRVFLKPMSFVESMSTKIQNYPTTHTRNFTTNANWFIRRIPCLFSVNIKHTKNESSSSSILFLKKLWINALRKDYFMKF